MEMPPLPQHQGELRSLPSGGVRIARPIGRVAYTADQMREYGELCARMAREQERERLAAKWEEAHGFDKYGVAAAIRAG